VLESEENVVFLPPKFLRAFGGSMSRNSRTNRDYDGVVAALSSPDLEKRIDAVGELVERGELVRPILISVLTEPSLPVLPRVWAMIALSQGGHVDDPAVPAALVSCLTDSSALIRRSAIDMLGELRAVSAVPHLAACLADHTPIPEAWFDDTATPAQAAKRALEAIGSPEAFAALAGVRSN
jgi:HEAT repeat protein